jgi:cytochrome c biogenesis protein ResB
LAAHVDADEVLEAAGAALRDHGFRFKWRGRSLVSLSWPIGTLGSAVFHWSIFALVLSVLVASLVRADGLMGVPIQARIPDVPASYGVLSAGPLHTWPAAPRTFEIEDLKIDYMKAGLNRGPTPIVVVRDAQGRVLARQAVYPNNPLRVASLTVHPNDYGLSAHFELVGADGASMGAIIRPLDFAEVEKGFTDPTEFSLTGPDGEEVLAVAARIPLDRRGSNVLHLVPKSPAAEVRVTETGGSTVASSTVPVGDAVDLPDGSRLRLVSVGYYARLSVVNDPTVPAVYLALLMGLIGMSVALFARQRAVIVRVSQSAGQATLEVTARLWRNAGMTAAELKSVLVDAAGPFTKERAE